MATELNLRAVITADDKASDVLKGVGQNINREVTKIGVGLAAVGTAFTVFTKKSIDSTTELVKNTKTLQRETGATTEEASGLLYVTNRLGISAEQTSQTFGIFSKKINEANKQTGLSAVEFQKLQNQIDKTKLQISLTEKEIKKNGDSSGELAIKLRELKTRLSELNEKARPTADTFDKLKVSLKNTDGTAKSFNEILLQTADAFKKMRDGPEKTALALELFGRSGKDMIKVLNLGSQGIRELEDNAKKLGLTLTSTNVAQVSRYIEAQKNLQDSTQALKIQIGLLTTPILTSFATTLNGVATSIIQTDGPLASLLAHIIAFGVPIAGASGGLLAFAANFGQVISAVSKLGLGFAGIAAFMTGPLGIAIAGVTVLAGVLTASWFRQASQVQALKTAQDNLKTSQDNLSNAQLNAEGAALNVERAQKNYTTAVKNFGPKSLEAREALQNLRVAQNNVKKANDDTKKAQEELARVQREVAKQKQLLKDLEEKRQAVQRLGDAAFSAGQQITLLNGRKVTVQTTKGVGGQQVIDFKSTFGARAKGGPVSSNTPYLVGEKGPELFTPTKSGRIIPNNEISPAGAGIINLHFHSHVGMFAGSPTERRNIAKQLMKDFQDAAKQYGLSPTALLDSMNGVAIR